MSGVLCSLLGSVENCLNRAGAAGCDEFDPAVYVVLQETPNFGPTRVRGRPEGDLREYFGGNLVGDGSIYRMSECMRIITHTRHTHAVVINIKLWSCGISAAW